MQIGSAQIMVMVVIALMMFMVMVMINIMFRLQQKSTYKVDNQADHGNSNGLVKLNSDRGIQPLQRFRSIFWMWRDRAAVSCCRQATSSIRSTGSM